MAEPDRSMPAEQIPADATTTPNTAPGAAPAGAPAADTRTTEPTAAGTTASGTTTSGTTASGTTTAGNTSAGPVTGDGTTAGDATTREGTAADGAIWDNGKAEDIRRRWHEVQTRFVEDPQGSLGEARQLLDETVDALNAGVRDREEQLEHAGARSSDSTEGMRATVLEYHHLLDRLLSV